MEEDLRGRLTGDQAIGAVVAASAIAWGDRPQALPAITLEVVSAIEEQHMADVQALQSEQVQVDVWSKDRLEARNIRRLVIAAIVPAATAGATNFRRSFVDQRSSSYELTDTGVIYRERIDLTVWHSPA